MSVAIRNTGLKLLMLSFEDMIVSNQPHAVRGFRKLDSASCHTLFQLNIPRKLRPRACSAVYERMPPFYTFELGLSDDLIRKHGSFLLHLLSEYAELLQTDENKMIGILSKAYPETHNDQLGRYYLRNFKANFPVRLYYGRLISSISGNSKSLAAAIRHLENT